MSSRVYRLAVLNSHPIQYFAPLYRRLAKEPALDLTVYYCSRQGAEAYFDPQFGRQVQWDISLLDGYRSKFLPNWRRQDRVRGFTSLLNPAIIAELQQQRYDALWLHGHSFATHLLAVAAAHLGHTPLMMRCETHLLLRRGPLKKTLRPMLMTALYRMFDATLPIGTLNADFYRHHGVPDCKMFPVPYTVDNDFFADAVRSYRNNSADIKRQLGIAQDKMVILFASKLTRRKRPMDLLRAFCQIKARGLNATLLLVGSGEEERALRAFCASHRLTSDVLFLGFQNQTLLPKWYAVADVFVLPSENEPWGLIINEVMAAGLPVVAARDIGAVPDLVHHGENGLLFPPGDVAALAEQLARLCGDRALCRKLGERSTELIQHWSYEQCVEGILAALAYTTGATHAHPADL